MQLLVELFCLLWISFGDTCSTCFTSSVVFDSPDCPSISSSTGVAGTGSSIVAFDWLISSTDNFMVEDMSFEGQTKSIPNNLYLLPLFGFFWFSILHSNSNEGSSVTGLEAGGHEVRMVFVSPATGPFESFSDTFISEDDVLSKGDFKSLNQWSDNLWLQELGLCKELLSILSVCPEDQRNRFSKLWAMMLFMDPKSDIWASAGFQIVELGSVHGKKRKKKREKTSFNYMDIKGNQRKEETSLLLPWPGRSKGDRALLFLIKPAWASLEVDMEPPKGSTSHGEIFSGLRMLDASSHCTWN